MADNARVVDAHQHFWNLGSDGYSWITPEFGVLNNTFGVADVEELADAAGVDDVVLVQADDTLEDTEAMLAIADAWPRVAGVVAWAPLTDEQALGPVLDRYAADVRVVGLRHLMHDEPDPDWTVRADVLKGLAAAGRVGLAYDVVAVLPRHLEHVPALAEQFPTMNIVIDHLAKPPIAAGGWEPWAGLLAAAAEFPNVSAKISGLDTAADPDDYNAKALSRYVDHALQAFGPQRLMFGSDWPVSTLAGGYLAWWQTVLKLLDGLSPDERRAVLGGTARKVYNLMSPE
ncbi:amidohydrolase family protein [Streptomyces sp. HNM0663]|uniref:Amidohydrolase family protein n=1 Tax=Streptomyces chengmaiensis TaxID=3040919 RepID=A0ABT6HZR9_9ACTN|nr:amidohydrolase family protein [Streptomyces chengmaiensis]MDH2394115.1 amidohydrolase family protein [Streptomyces chengmaiensis]